MQRQILLKVPIIYAFTLVRKTILLFLVAGGLAGSSPTDRAIIPYLGHFLELRTNYYDVNPTHLVCPLPSIDC